MKQALILIDEIKTEYRAIKKTKSTYLANDRYKHIVRLKNELRDYCKFKGLDFKELLKELKEK